MQDEPMDDEKSEGADVEGRDVGGGEGAENVDDFQKEENLKPNHAKAKSYPASYGVNDKDGKDAVLNEAESEQPSVSMDATTAEGASGKGSGEGQDNSGAAGSSGDSNAPPSKSQGDTPPNPFQSKGDISSAWYRRLDIVETSESNQHQDQVKNDVSKGAYEFADADSSSQEQVLASAVDDDVAALPEQQEEEPSDLPPHSDDNKDLLQNTKERSTDTSLRRKSLNNREERESTTMAGRNDEDTAGQEMEYEGTMLTEDATPLQTDLPDRQKHDKAVYSKVIEEESLEEAYTIEPLAVEEMNLNEIKHHEDADRNWLLLRNQTEIYSHRLCEQLRLILEPQLASRLQGDYRSGKRINMRKVIGYVASGFRRDKIWLRRTKPSKRDYQVMLLVDDSRSMKEAGSLTMSAVATIATALSKVEVGDVCVASFADKVRVLHPFGNTTTLKFWPFR